MSMFMTLRMPSVRPVRIVSERQPYARYGRLKASMSRPIRNALRVVSLVVTLMSHVLQCMLCTIRMICKERRCSISMNSTPTVLHSKHGGNIASARCSPW